MYPDLEKNKLARSQSLTNSKSLTKRLPKASAFATRTLIRREGKMTKVPEHQVTTVTHRLLSKYSHELGHLHQQHDPNLVANSRLMRYELEHDAEMGWQPVLGGSTRIVKDY